MRLLPFLLPFLLVACGKLANTAPERETRASAIPPQTSRVALELHADLGQLEAALNAEVPQTILAVDEKRAECVPPARLTICLRHAKPCKGEACKDVPCRTGFKQAKVTPAIGCRLVGDVTRGPIRVSGSGDTLRLSMPVAGAIRATELVGFIGTNEATGKADVTADVRFAIGPDWTPVPKVDLRYHWDEPPGVRLGPSRITFEKQADQELQKLIARLERDLPSKVRALHPRALLEKGWREAHTSIELNARNPQVWMRVTPKALSVQPYRVSGRDVVLPLVFEAVSETFVGPRPPDPPAGPLPPPAELSATGFRLVIPVVADYRVLEGVLHKALIRAAAKGISVPVLGDVDATFGPPVLYATRDRRVAVGLPMDAAAGVVKAKGVVWLTGEVWNAPDTQQLQVRDLRVTGDIAGPQGALLLAVAQAPVVQDAIATELGQNFTRDFEKLLDKIHVALTDKRIGPFVLNARIEDVDNGVLQPLGQGAFLLVEAAGNAELRWAPPTATATAQR